jgi:hypothetical protein
MYLSKGLYVASLIGKTCFLTNSTAPIERNQVNNDLHAQVLRLDRH